MDYNIFQILGYVSFYYNFYLLLYLNMKNNQHFYSLFFALILLITTNAANMAYGSNSYGPGYNSGSSCALSTIRVIGNGQIQVDADIAIIYAYITQDGTTVSDAINKVNTILTSVQSVLKQNNVSKSDVSTSYISVYPKYDYSNGTGVVVGYTVYVSLTIKIRGIDKDQTKVGDVIEGLASSGVSSISGITYDTSQPQAGKSFARKAALADALRKAEEYAKLLRERLGKVLTVDETNIYYSPYMTNSQGILIQQANGVPNGSSTQINLALPPGKVTIVVNVIVVWLIKEIKY